MKTILAFVGCGYVADLYFESIQSFSQLSIKGVYDKDKTRCKHFSDFYNLKEYHSLKEISEDDEIDIVVNLTNPKNHYKVTKFFLENEKHVYSEKPLTDNYQLTKELIHLAESKGLYLAGAPSTMLSSTARTIQKAIEKGKVGTPRLVYAELDDGPIDLMRCDKWFSKSGTPWPIEDEFNVGCTLEHAGYYVSWMLHLFGPAKSVVSFSKCLKPQKRGLKIETPDFSVGIIHFQSGVVARITNGIYAPHNQQFMVVGDKGTIETNNCFHSYADVLFQEYNALYLRTKAHPFENIPGVKTLLKILKARKTKLPLLDAVPPKYRLKKNYIDFGLGINELAEAICNNRPALFTGDFLQHLNEIIFALSDAGESGQLVELESSFFKTNEKNNLHKVKSNIKEEGKVITSFLGRFGLGGSLKTAMKK